MTDKKDLDVAISFLSKDGGLANSLRDGLGTSLDVFVYDKKQEELAGTDGLETLRDVFRNRAKLVVILFRERWGETEWTRVEKQAVEERFLKEGPQFLFVVMLDDSAPPKWLPAHLIRFNFQDFGLDQAIGAIKARALELGSVVHAPSVAFLAARAREVAEFGKRRSQLLGSDVGARQAADEAKNLMDLIEARADEIMAKEPSLKVEFGANPDWCVIRKELVAVGASYRNIIINSLEIAEFWGPIKDQLRGAPLRTDPSRNQTVRRALPKQSARKSA